MSVDFSIFQIIHGLAGKWWLLNWLGVFFAEYSGYLIVFFSVFLLIREKNWRQQIYFFALAGLSVILARGIITEVIRFFYYRARPFLALGFQPLIEHGPSGSLPSGNAAAFFALGLVIFYFTRYRKIKPVWWPLIFALLMGVARVFVGVHWPSDVLVGALIGLASAFVVKQILPKQIKPA